MFGGWPRFCGVVSVGPEGTLTSIHLHSHLQGELGANTPLHTLQAAIVLGLGLLLMGAINFINLTNARSLLRYVGAKEI